MGLGPHGTNGGRRVGLLSTLASDVGPAVPAAADGGFGAISLATMPAPVPRTRPCWLCFSGELMNTWEWLRVGRAGLLGDWLLSGWIQASPHVVPMRGFRRDAPLGLLRLAQCGTRSSLVVPLPVLPTSRLSFPICHRMVSLSSRAVRTERRGLEALIWAQLPGAVFSADLALGPQERRGMAARPCTALLRGPGGMLGWKVGPRPLLSTQSG